MGEDLQHVQTREAEHRLHVPLRVQGQAVLVHAPVQVHRELRDAQQARGVHEDRRPVGQGEPARESQLPVQPGVQQRSAVDLDAHLAEPLGAEAGIGLDLQGGGVGVGADDPEGGGRVRALGGGPGDERAVAQHEAVAGDVACGPGRGLHQLGEARRGQAPGRLAGGVEARGGGGDEGAEVERGGAGAGGGGRGGEGGHPFIEPSVPRQGSMRSSFASPTCSTTSAAPVSEISLSPV